VTITVLIGARLPIDDPPTVPLQLAETREETPSFSANKLKLRHEIRIGLVAGAVGIIVMGLVLAHSFGVLTRTMMLAAGAVAILVIIAGALSAIVDRRRYRRQKTTL